MRLLRSGREYMYKRSLVATALLLLSSAIPVYAQWNSSPYNFQNSPYNFNNSPYNFNNSPFNFQNSPYNLNSNRGIYDEEGNRSGYAVPRSDGGVNIFDNDGNRAGYVPSPWPR